MTERMANNVGIQKRVRARRESSSDGEFSSSESASVTTIDQEEDESDSNNNDVAASISFGALAKAQAALSMTSTQGKISHRNPDEETEKYKHSQTNEREISRRQNKHAPTETSSKRAVTRKREVVPLVKRVARDPRFEPGNAPIDEKKVRTAYSFLDDYREDEIKELKATIKSTKDEDEKKKLKRALLIMESRKKTQLRKQKELEVLERHMKQEKDLVKQGKKPYYLKKAELRNQVLLDRFKELKGKQLDRVIERRRKKVDGKEKKKIPFSRRSRD